MALAVSAPTRAPAPTLLLSRPAPVRPGLVPRDRLVRRLIEARDVPVALVVAPAGYGKTTLLSEWSDRDPRPFAWVTLDADADDPRVLLAAVVAALSEVEPVGWDVEDALASDARGASPLTMRRLARSLGRRRKPVVLVLDDVHAVRTRAGRQVLGEVWRAADGVGLQVALSSRSDAALPVARLRALGNSVEVRADDLAMTRSEAAALLRLAGLDLDAEQALGLMRATEGWPTGLHLAALALRQRGRRGRRAEAFSGDDRFVADYVREEMLAGLDEEELGFLTRTSVLDELSAPVCDHVLRRRDSADLLARLERMNVLISAVDRRAGTYRYNPLFATALRGELERREPGEAAALHRRASGWCARRADAPGAIHHAIESGDVRRAGRLLWDSTLEQAAAGDDQVSAWLGRFPDHEVADSALLAVVGAGAALVGGNLYEAERWASLARTVPDEDEIVQGGLALVRAGAARNGIARMGADAEEAGERLGETSPWWPVCLLLRGVALQLGGHAEAARERLESSVHLAAVSAPIVQALALSQLSLLVADGGDPDRAAVLVGRARAQLARCGLEGRPQAALVLAVSAELRAAEGQTTAAATELRTALRLMSQIVDPPAWYEAQCAMVAARTSLRLGGPVAAAEHLRRAAAVAGRTTGAPVLEAWVADAEARLDLTQGDEGAATWSLTAAELRVLRHLPSHLSFREIAARLYVSPNTVKTHARGIYRKLDVSSRGEAVERAREAGVLEAG